MQMTLSKNEGMYMQNEGELNEKMQNLCDMSLAHGRKNFLCGQNAKLICIFAQTVLYFNALKDTKDFTKCGGRME